MIEELQNLNKEIAKTKETAQIEIEKYLKQFWKKQSGIEMPMKNKTKCGNNLLTHSKYFIAHGELKIGSLVVEFEFLSISERPMQ